MILAALIVICGCDKTPFVSDVFGLRIYFKKSKPVTLKYRNNAAFFS
jgi:hypothetical protein